MKVATKDSNVTTSGTESTGNFSIKASAKAFEILSSGLYTDKIKAFIRELSTNAYDSQIAAGYGDKPFKVTLPTSLEPVFKVRDFGTGLSDEDVMQVYTTYFESTKTDSDDFVGALGLGSKSPFSYTDNFSVTSFFNGRKTHFTAYLDGGLPKITKTMSEPTAELNGLEVSLAIKLDDIYQVKSKAEEVYKWFKVTPDVNMELNLDQAWEIALEGDKWKLLTYPNDRRYYRTQQAYVTMGNIVYPIPASTFKDRTMRNLAENNFLIECEIGDVEMSASRESLSMTEDTVKFLVDKFTEIAKEISETVRLKIESQGTDWGKIAEYNTVVPALPRGMDNSINFILEGRTYSGQVIKTMLDTDLLNVNITLFTNGRKSGYSTTSGIFTFKPNNKTKVLIADKRVGAQMVAKELRDTHGICILITPRLDVKADKLEQVCKSAIQSFGNPDYEKVSDHYVPVSRKGINTGGVRKRLSKINVKRVIGSIGSTYCYTETIPLDLDNITDVVYYLPTLGGSIMDSDWEMYKSEVGYAVAYLLLRELHPLSPDGDKPFRLVLVPKSYKNKALACEEMVDFYTFISKSRKLGKFFSNEQVYEDLLSSLNISDWEKRRILEKDFLKETILRELIEYGNSNVLTYATKRLWQTLDDKVTFPELKVPKKYTTLETKYPMLPRCIGTGDFTLAKEYLRLVDNQKRTRRVSNG